MLTEQDYIEAANKIGCEVAAIKAVTKIEAPRGGFDDEGRVTILFEPYIFYKELRKKGIDCSGLLKKFPTLISDHWNPKLYGKYSQQWDKLHGAANINTECAYRSASYGMFQIMGFHAESLGFKDVFNFYYIQRQSEKDQLLTFCKYIIINHLNDELINKNWEDFARQYNGPLYYKNKYAKKLKREYAKFRH